MRGTYNLRPDLEILDQSGSGRGVKLYAPMMVWSNSYDQNNTYRIGLCNKKITRTDKFVVATGTSRLQVT